MLCLKDLIYISKDECALLHTEDTAPHCFEPCYSPFGHGRRTQTYVSELQSYVTHQQLHPGLEGGALGRGHRLGGLHVPGVEDPVPGGEAGDARQVVASQRDQTGHVARRLGVGLVRLPQLRQARDVDLEGLGFRFRA